MSTMAFDETSVSVLKFATPVEECDLDSDTSVTAKRAANLTTEPINIGSKLQSVSERECVRSECDSQNFGIHTGKGKEYLSGA